LIPKTPAIHDLKTRSMFYSRSHCSKRRSTRPVTNIVITHDRVCAYTLDPHHSSHFGCYVSIVAACEAWRGDVRWHTERRDVIAPSNWEFERIRM